LPRLSKLVFAEDAERVDATIARVAETGVGPFIVGLYRRTHGDAFGCIHCETNGAYAFVGGNRELLILRTGSGGFDGGSTGGEGMPMEKME
jgi:hypothetical protein